MPEQRRCKECGEVKPVTDFHLQRKPSGTVYPRARCKPCMNAYNQRHLPNEGRSLAETGYYRSERYRAFNRKRISAYVKGNKRIADRVRQYWRAHPERVRAWKAVERAVRKGTLIRPDRCSCERAMRVIAHHDDYSKPLDVLWLCDVCHKARHRWLAGQEAA